MVVVIPASLMEPYVIRSVMYSLTPSPETIITNIALPVHHQALTAFASKPRVGLVLMLRAVPRQRATQDLTAEVTNPQEIDIGEKNVNL